MYFNFEALCNMRLSISVRVDCELFDIKYFIIYTMYTNITKYICYTRGYTASVVYITLATYS